MGNQDVTRCCCLVLFASAPNLFGPKVRGVCRLEQMNFRGPDVGATANVLIVCQDVLERLMRLVLLAVIAITVFFTCSMMLLLHAACIMAQYQAAKCCMACLNLCPALHACMQTGMNQHFSLDCYTPQGLSIATNAAHASEQFSALCAGLCCCEAYP